MFGRSIFVSLQRGTVAVIFVVADEEGIVRVERREESTVQRLLQTKEFAQLAFRGVEAINPLALATEVAFHDAVVISIVDSKRLTEGEKLEFLNILGTANPITDSYEGETIPGEFARTHQVSDVPGKPAYPVVTRVIDP